MESIGARDRDDVFEVLAFVSLFVVLEADLEKVQIIPWK